MQTVYGQQLYANNLILKNKVGTFSSGVLEMKKKKK